MEIISMQNVSQTEKSQVRTPKITATQIRILEQIDYLSRQQAKRSRWGARYCCPGQAYLARKIGVHPVTVSKAVTDLADKGILSVTHRRKVRGIWQTNLYRIMSRCWWRLGKIVRMLVNPRRPFSQNTKHNSPKKEIDNQNTRMPQKIGEIPLLKMWMERGKLANTPT